MITVDTIFSLSLFTSDNLRLLVFLVTYTTHHTLRFFLSTENLSPPGVGWHSLWTQRNLARSSTTVGKESNEQRLQYFSISFPTFKLSDYALGAKPHCSTPQHISHLCQNYLESLKNIYNCSSDQANNVLLTSYEVTRIHRHARAHAHTQIVYLAIRMG